MVSNTATRSIAANQAVALAQQFHTARRARQHLEAVSRAANALTQECEHWHKNNQHALPNIWDATTKDMDIVSAERWGGMSADQLKAIAADPKKMGDAHRLTRVLTSFSSVVKTTHEVADNLSTQLDSGRGPFHRIGWIEQTNSVLTGCGHIEPLNTYTSQVRGFSQKLAAAELWIRQVKRLLPPENAPTHIRNGDIGVILGFLRRTSGGNVNELHFNQNPYSTFVGLAKEGKELMVKVHDKSSQLEANLRGR